MKIKVDSVSRLSPRSSILSPSRWLSCTAVLTRRHTSGATECWPPPSGTWPPPPGKTYHLILWVRTSYLILYLMLFYYVYKLEDLRSYLNLSYHPECLSLSYKQQDLSLPYSNFSKNIIFTARRGSGSSWTAPRTPPGLRTWTRCWTTARSSAWWAGRSSTSPPGCGCCSRCLTSTLPRQQPCQGNFYHPS